MDAVSHRKGVNKQEAYSNPIQQNNVTTIAHKTKKALRTEESELRAFDKKECGLLLSRIALQYHRRKWA